MAKVSFTKLGLKMDQEIKTIKFNEQEIEIKQYIPIEAKLQFIENVLNQSAVDMYFYNQGKIEVFFAMEVIYNYTNINFTDKQKDDILGLFDKFVSTGLYKEILNNIPTSEIEFLKEVIQDQIKEIYRYRDSALGIMETMKTDYNNLDLDINELTRELTENENLGLVKEVIEKLN